MLYIRNQSLDPHYNLALEEYALKNLDPQESYILLWQNAPSVIIGRFQNTLEEINPEYIKEQGIHVVRRMTGGGAVYHDLGNLNFSFIEKSQDGKINFRKFTEPVIKALAKMGVTAEDNGRNDITIDGKKFSGNAQYHFKGKTLHHGTLLYNAKLEDVQAALRVRADKMASKGVKSVRSRVTNIAEYLPRKISLEEFRQQLLEDLFQGGPVQEYKLSPVDEQKIRQLMEEKYLTWEWNYGRSPAFNVVKKGRFAWGGIEMHLNVEKGLIQDCKIYGDFFSNQEMDSLEKQFCGVKFKAEDLAVLLNQVELSQYFGPVSREEFLELLTP
ncbi:lipoate--protein ligase [Desulforamulus ruminis]|uniref:lipoate--protein ligase n=1 Tax=Desulforamulus ruminis (strain ATCC 23193 / DSM 2154 / NCIMB 8452 / DL) TaxID=696281 RepID=F6DVL2_DESRL|nr:lipoate--protein ligase [Desulforamulus ruminis]AEG61472.1 lipoyltransferase and lipoate-protein ligase [Desulforamulus ruminis DSM 2154]